MAFRPGAKQRTSVGITTGLIGLPSPEEEWGLLRDFSGLLFLMLDRGSTFSHDERQIHTLPTF
jgi:hypothetical protein